MMCKGCKKFIPSSTCGNCLQKFCAKCLINYNYLLKLAFKTLKIKKKFYVNGAHFCFSCSEKIDLNNHIDYEGGEDVQTDYNNILAYIHEKVRRIENGTNIYRIT